MTYRHLVAVVDDCRSEKLDSTCSRMINFDNYSSSDSLRMCKRSFDIVDGSERESISLPNDRRSSQSISAGSERVANGVNTRA